MRILLSFRSHSDVDLTSDTSGGVVPIRENALSLVNLLFILMYQFWSKLITHGSSYNLSSVMLFILYRIVYLLSFGPSRVREN